MSMKLSMLNEINSSIQATEFLLRNLKKLYSETQAATSNAEPEDVLQTLGIDDEELRLQFAMLARFEKQKKTENETNSKDSEAPPKKSVATTQAPTAAPANISVTRLQVEGKLYLIL